MHERERRLAEGANRVAPAHRALAAEHPLLLLQRTAGNAAVSGLLAGISVQRFWPFDDEEGEGEEETPEDGPEEAGEEEVPKNPSEQMPNAPPEGSPEAAMSGVSQWTGRVGPHQVAMWGEPRDPGSRADRSCRSQAAGMAAAFSRNLPHEPIPPEISAGGSGYLVLEFSIGGPIPVADTRDVVAKQAMRYVAGAGSPDIERILNQPGGTPVPGGGPSPVPEGGPAGPGGGGAAPGGIPGMEPVPPGGAAGPGGIPGMEPVPPGGGGAGAGGIPGMEPVPGPSGPGIEPAPPGAGPGPGGTRPMLRVGSTGDVVRQAQALLLRHGATIELDGQFGPATRRAVVDFQRSAGLSPDGVVGPQTWRALESA
jgi:hypothetical protein